MNTFFIIWLILLICAALPFLISAVNLLTAVTLTPAAAPAASETVSVLIPARNEEKNLTSCLDSVIRDQSGCVTEIIVYDDCSTDATPVLARAASLKDRRVSCITGAQLPKGWLGKNYACSRLAERAQGSLLLFIDADVVLSPFAVQTAIIQMQKFKAGLLSAFPTQIIPAGSAWAVIPLMNRILLSSLMLRLLPLTRHHSLAAANGQFMLFTRECYNAVGGHAAVRSEAVEDITLARIVKKSGRTLVTVLGGSCISCTMYPDAQSAFTGFTKNLYPGTKLPLPVFVLIVMYTEIVFWLPVFLLPVSLWFVFPFILHILREIMIARTGKISVIRSLLWLPMQELLFIFLAASSVWKSRSRTLTWKGRKI